MWGERDTSILAQLNALGVVDKGKLLKKKLSQICCGQENVKDNKFL